jgi:hypothetical protein
MKIQTNDAHCPPLFAKLLRYEHIDFFYIKRKIKQFFGSNFHIVGPVTAGAITPLP